MMEVYLYMIGISVVSFFGISILFKRCGLVDKPDGIRKIHEGEISLGGGIAMFLPVIIFLLFIFEGDLSFSYIPLLVIVFYVSIIILLLGLYDDIKPLPFSARLIVQIFASWLVIILTDVHVVNLGNLLGFGNLYLSELGIPITIFMVVGVCNAFNMLDGMDGLVGIVIFVSVSAISFMAIFTGIGDKHLYLGSILLLGLLLTSCAYNLKDGNPGALAGSIHAGRTCAGVVERVEVVAACAVVGGIFGANAVWNDDFNVHKSYFVDHLIHIVVERNTDEHGKTQGHDIICVLSSSINQVLNLAGSNL